MGTFEEKDFFEAPQPEGSIRLQNYADGSAKNWAKIPLIVAIHSERDRTASMKDVKYMVDATNNAGGRAHLQAIPPPPETSKRNKM